MTYFFKEKWILTALLMMTFNYPNDILTLSPGFLPITKVEKTTLFDGKDLIVSDQYLESSPAILNQGIKTKLGIKGTGFTINGETVFLCGISYYGGLGTPGNFIIRDLEDIKNFGFNWIRVWATWKTFSADVSAVDHDGNIAEPYMSKLLFIVDECNKAGIIVDITLSRGEDGGSINSFDSHIRAVSNLVTHLKAYSNWYLDMANEHNIKDNRFVSYDELKQLCFLAKKIKPDLLVTASNGCDILQEELKEYLFTVGIDFICPHRGRTKSVISETSRKTKEYLSWMKELGRMIPVHYQEPFRKGYSKGWEPGTADFIADLKNAIAGGAAGWCFHNGSQKGQADLKPWRSFDMTEERLFEQLDDEEIKALTGIRTLITQK
jgi:hypothetical protein